MTGGGHERDAVRRSLEVAPAPSQLDAWSKRASTLRDVVLAAGGGLLVGGFVVDSIYLSSLGITEIGIPNTRHVLIGAMFGVYLAAVVVPLWILLRELRRVIGRSPWLAVLTWAKTTLFSYFGIALLIGAISLLSVPQTPEHLALAPLPDPFNFFSYAASRVTSTTWTAASFIVVAVAILLLLSLYADRRMRQTAALQEKNPPATSLVHVLHTLGATSIVLVVVFLWNGFTGDIRRVTRISPGFGALVTHAITVYLMVGSWLVLGVALKDDSSSDGDESLTPAVSATSYFVLFSMLIATVLPAYSLRVFPYLPRSLGGSLPVSATLLLKKEAIEGHEHIHGMPCMILDEAPSQVLVTCGGTPTYPVAISRDVIVSLRYGRK